MSEPIQLTPEDLAYHYADYIRHVDYTMRFIAVMQGHLIDRMLTHDRSKVYVDIERDTYAKVVPGFKGLQFGTEEHKAQGRKLGPAWDSHVEHNRHHPEHFANGVNDMNLIDIIEMLCDWRAAGMRTDGDIQKSIDICCERFGIGDQLKHILENTAQLLNEFSPSDPMRVSQEPE